MYTFVYQPQTFLHRSFTHSDQFAYPLFELYLRAYRSPLSAFSISPSNGEMTHVCLCVPIYYTPARLAYMLHPICMLSGFKCLQPRILL